MSSLKTALGRISRVEGAWFTAPGSDRTHRVESGRLVATGGVVDERTRTTSFLFEVDNADRRLRAGMAVEAFVAVGLSEAGPSIPARAIVRDGSEELCFVQIGGESFARRRVVTGVREGDWVQVLRGVSVGERVVTRGAFAVKLAGSADQVPAHGHVH